MDRDVECGETRVGGKGAGKDNIQCIKFAESLPYVLPNKNYCLEEVVNSVVCLPT